MQALVAVEITDGEQRLLAKAIRNLTHTIIEIATTKETTKEVPSSNLTRILIDEISMTAVSSFLRGVHELINKASENTKQEFSTYLIREWTKNKWTDEAHD